MLARGRPRAPDSEACVFSWRGWREVARSDRCGPTLTSPGVVEQAMLNIIAAYFFTTPRFMIILLNYLFIYLT